MAEVSIDIDAMQSLVTAMEGALGDIPGSAGSIYGNLSYVMLSTAPVASLGHGSAVVGWMEGAIRDLNRRLSLARLIQASTPGISVVTFDDSVLSTATDAEVQAGVDRLLELMAVAEDDFDPRSIDPELLQLLEDNALDPYFAQALAGRLDPQALDDYLRLVNNGMFEAGHQGPEELEQFETDFDSLVTNLGLTLGLASQGTGSLAVPGLADRWVEFIEQDGPMRSGSVNRLSVVISRGMWSDEFILGVTQKVMDLEGDSGQDYWAIMGMEFPYDPRPDGEIEAHLALDPLAGLFTAMQSNPEVVRQLFATGDTTTLSADGSEHQVNEQFYRMIRHRGMEDETFTAFLTAIQSAIAAPPREGQPAFQMELAADLQIIATALEEEAQRAEEEAGPLWAQIGHGILDLIGMFPVLGEPADLINGVWYYAEGDVINGSLSMGGAIPFAGWVSVGGKWVRRGLNAEELANLNRLARNGENIRLFTRDGTLLDDAADLTNPANFHPDRFLSPAELQRWSGNREFMRRLIAGNRFNAFLNPRYAYSEVPLTTGSQRPFRLDSYTPGEAIVSRKLTQLSQIQPATARGYIDEFASKYPAGTRIADTPSTRDLGIAGDRLSGDMILELPPQIGPVPDEVIEYAWSQRPPISIVDINGVDYTAAWRERVGR